MARNRQLLPHRFGKSGSCHASWSFLMQKFFAPAQSKQKKKFESINRERKSRLRFFASLPRDKIFCRPFIQVINLIQIARKKAHDEMFCDAEKEREPQGRGRWIKCAEAQSTNIKEERRGGRKLMTQLSLLQYLSDV